jgi:hypothetical protein
VKLIAYLVDNHGLEIRPAPPDRAWMDATDQRYAYRCLPLNIANSYGWEILCPVGFTAIWDGEPGINAIKIVKGEGEGLIPISHFGSGILTFHVNCLFRTEPGFDLMVQGPVNRAKDAIAPLQGVVETDWAPYTFTMNWRFTQPEIEVEFEKGEPFCHFFPIRRADIEAVEPEFRQVSTDPKLEAEYRAWNESRRAFNRDLNEAGSKAQAERWQKHYYRGVDIGGAPIAEAGHRTRVRVRDFRR